MNMRGKGGFTLVELMIVAIIVAILAAVAIPLMSANKTRAMATEAESACGTVRSALRAMYAETDAYNKDHNGLVIAPGTPAVPRIPGLLDGDLDGRYFSDECYDLTKITASTYEITATGAKSTAPEKEKVKDVVIKLDHNGKFTRSGF